MFATLHAVVMKSVVLGRAPLLCRIPVAIPEDAAGEEQCNNGDI